MRSLLPDISPDLHAFLNFHSYIRAGICTTTYSQQWELWCFLKLQYWAPEEFRSG